ncbi:glutathione S-transferase theta-2-like [Echinops telfairi]|uniref:glutathione transferase n=2 Tax=Echinops telfairi TaxID=9371 RepID=A0ABM0J753_ECHTE|nr:glutathione S-transferase theta-2-like [Echinops telfairi]XP_045145572.1 glutathione S-transferase theta-2-like [Echinops telfairi]
MGLELYLDLLSQPCRAVYIFAKKNRIPFELHTVDLLKGQQVSKHFSKLNSLRKVPALKDDDFVLTESTAILIYLSQKYQTEDHWYPAELQARARVHEYLGWHADFIRGTFGVMLWTKVLAPLIGTQVPEEKVRRNRTALEEALDKLNARFLGNKPFLTGQQVTLADIMALEEMMQPIALGLDLYEGRQQLASWHRRVEAFLGAELCEEAHGPIMTILEQMACKTIPIPPPEAHPPMLKRLAKIP